MSRTLLVTTVLFLGVTSLTGCATRGQLRRAQEEQSASLAAERAERAALEESLRAELAALRTDVDALQSDLEGLRTEFNTTITALEEGMRFAMPVHFGFDEDEVQADDHAALDRFAQVVQRHYPGSLITVEGFADPAGPAAYNRRLSERRAEAVRGYLVGRGISEGQVRAVGYGETRQVIPGAAGREPEAELNRRVVFVVEGGRMAAPTPTDATSPPTSPGATR